MKQRRAAAEPAPRN